MNRKVVALGSVSALREEGFDLSARSGASHGEQDQTSIGLFDGRVADHLQSSCDLATDLLGIDVDQVVHASEPRLELSRVPLAEGSGAPDSDPSIVRQRT